MELNLFKEICELFAEKENVELIDFVELNGVKYTLEEVDEEPVEDYGKYQCGATIYAVGVLDEAKGYGIDDTLFYIRQDFVRSGSYYSDYYYEYEKPFIVEKKEVITYEWEAI